MQEDGRLNPEDFLAVAAKEDKSKGKGHLKVFLGMAAGVGKTYSMLEEAQEEKNEGVNVVIGIVDPHGRKETEELARGIRVIPLKTVTYKDKDFYEMDVEAIIADAPDLVLVDELAHTNVPGLKHAKRWEDVVEILEAGIDVYTTLNIQHIESLNDIIGEITGILVRETVPDFILEQAASIHLVDISPEELLERLKEGKVYLGEQSLLAAQHFFQKDRLTALRELVLRYTAERVDRDLHDMSLSQEGAKLLKPREKLLVAISHRPHSEKLIRMTRRLAWNLDAPWYALHVDTGQHLDENENNQLLKNLALAREFGGEVLSTYGPDVAAGILRIAHHKGATQIIVGRPHRRLLDYFRGFSVVDRLAKEGSDVDLHVIRHEHHLTLQKKKLHVHLPKKDIHSYIFVFLWVCFLTLLSVMLENVYGYKLVRFIFLLGVLSSSLFFRKGPILFGSVLSMLVLDYFFIDPRDSFKIASFDDRAFIAILFLSALITGILVDRARLQKVILAKKERYTRALNDVLQKIVFSPTIESAFASITEILQGYFQGSIEFIADDPKEEFNPKIGGLITDEKEKIALCWSIDNGKEAGWSTNTLPSLKNLYIPLRGYYSTVGALVYHPKSSRLFLDSDERGFLYTVAQQVAHFAERVFLEKNLQVEGLKKKEDEVFDSVISSLSKEIKSPLNDLQEAIFGAVNVLKAEAKQKTTKHLYHQIREVSKSTQALAQVFTNVSAMAKLNQSPISLVKERVNVHELLGISCKNIARNLGILKLSFNLQERLPDILCDWSLMELLFYHLMQNTKKYSPLDSTLRIEAIQKGHEVQILFFSIINEEGGTKGPPPFLSNEMNMELKIASKIVEIHEGHLVMDFLATSGIKFILFFPGVIIEKIS